MLLAASAALLVTPSAASAATCDTVASRTGSDANAGTEASPYKTAQKAVGALAAGQTACLRGGLYDEQNGGQTVVRFPRGGVALRSFPGERATVRGVVYVPKGSDGVTISDLDLDGRQAVATQSSPPVGIQILAADTVVERNDITNHGVKSCMILGSNAGYGQAVRPVVRLNRFHGCGDPANGNKDHSIYAENSLDGQIVDNVFTGSAAYAIHLYPNADRNLVARNVIDGNARGVIFAGNLELTSDSNVVERNVIANTHERYNVEGYWSGPVGSGNVARGNCLHNGASGDLSSQTGFVASDNVIADPQFADRAAGDLRLRPGSPCLAIVGQDTAALVSEALGEAPRPAPEPGPVPGPSTGPAPAAPAVPAVAPVAVAAAAPATAPAVAPESAAPAKEKPAVKRKKSSRTRAARAKARRAKQARARRAKLAKARRAAVRRAAARRSAHR